MRRLETDADGRSTEVLELPAGLTAQPDFEYAVRASVARLAQVEIAGLARVLAVERRRGAVYVVSEHIEGLRLPEFLQETIKGNIPLPQAAALELAGRILRVVSAMHQVLGLTHGAITPAHVVVTRNGGVVLTDAVFGAAIEGLQRNREELWREFRLALPASASLPRFDQRADITQLGATVLAVALGRPLRASEYPRAINEAVIAATLGARPGESGTSTSALRMWLQKALHLHPRAVFASAGDADQAWSEVLGAAAVRRGGAAALEKTVERVFGDTPAAAAAAELAVAWSHPQPAHHASEPFVPQEPPLTHRPAAALRPSEGGFSSILRSVFRAG